MNSKFKQMEENIVLFKDQILHEIVDLRDDVAVVTGYRNMIEDHEQRLQVLEKKN